MDVCFSHETALAIIREARCLGGARLMRARRDSLSPAASASLFAGTQLDALGLSSIARETRRGPLDILLPSHEGRTQVGGVASHVLSTELWPDAIVEVVTPGQRGGGRWVTRDGGGQVTHCDGGWVTREGGGQATHCDGKRGTRGGGWQMAGHDSRPPWDGRVLVVGPTLCVIQEAGRLQAEARTGEIPRWVAVVRLVELCAELMGTYSRHPLRPQSGECTFRLPKLTTKERLLEELSLAHDIDGLALARRAAKLAPEGSASPAETLHALADGLPNSLGGLRIQGLQLNRQVPMDGACRRLVSNTRLRPDVSWARYRVAIEHLGDDWHSSRDARAIDARRIQDYQVLKWKVHPASHADIATQAAFNRFALRVCESLESAGYRGLVARVRRLYRDKEFMCRQGELLSMLRWHPEPAE